MTNNYEHLFDLLTNTPISSWIPQLPNQLNKAFDISKHGLIKEWQLVLEQLPDITPSVIDLNSDMIQIGSQNDCDDETRAQLTDLLMNFHPWRKGPFSIFGTDIETEWRSDLKWNRLKDHISPLKDRYVLDIGCGNGYHGMRCIGAGAKSVIGVDPFLIFIMQHLSLKRYLSELPFFVLPFGIEEVPENVTGFDTLFSMGVLYHRRSPIDHLMNIKALLRSGGELILETLIINDGDMLIPEGRYAKMRNIWFIPSPSIIETWLRRCGYKNIRIVDITQTTTQEQRSTNWMNFESLPDFLDKSNPYLTIEGHPAPVRAIFIAEKG